MPHPRLFALFMNRATKLMKPMFGTLGRQLTPETENTADAYGGMAALFLPTPVQYFTVHTGTVCMLVCHQRNDPTCSVLCLTQLFGAQKQPCLFHHQSGQLITILFPQFRTTAREYCPFFNR